MAISLGCVVGIGFEWGPPSVIYCRVQLGRSRTACKRERSCWHVGLAVQKPTNPLTHMPMQNNPGNKRDYDLDRAHMHVHRGRSTRAVRH
eukprot:4840202-Prymnesium_polylepis.1